jgi:hypothetical protein
MMIFQKVCHFVVPEKFTMGRNPLYALIVLSELYKITNTRFKTESHTWGPSLVSLLNRDFAKRACGFTSVAT